jgi:hypothetical protein
MNVVVLTRGDSCFLSSVEGWGREERGEEMKIYLRSSRHRGVKP